MIPPALLSVFSFSELELLLCGVEEVDVDDWRRHTLYTGGYTAKSNMVKWWSGRLVLGSCTSSGEPSVLSLAYDQLTLSGSCTSSGEPSVLSLACEQLTLSSKKEKEHTPHFVHEKVPEHDLSAVSHLMHQLYS